MLLAAVLLLLYTHSSTFTLYQLPSSLSLFSALLRPHQTRLLPPPNTLSLSLSLSLTHTHTNTHSSLQHTSAAQLPLSRAHSQKARVRSACNFRAYPSYNSNSLFLLSFCPAWWWWWCSLYGWQRPRVSERPKTEGRWKEGYTTVCVREKGVVTVWL